MRGLVTFFRSVKNLLVLWVGVYGIGACGIGACFLTSCGYIDVRNVNRFLKSEDCQSAEYLLLELLKKEPQSFKYSYNLIHSFLCKGELEQARKQVDVLLSANTPHKYELFFLKGFILGELGQTSEALATYQKALDIKPDVKIKQNMELLLKRSKQGKKGKKSQKNKSEGQESSGDQGSNAEDKPSPKSQPSNDNNENDDSSSQEKKRMTKDQVEKIMKEIESNEKKVRSKGVRIKSKKGGESSGKNW